MLKLVTQAFDLVEKLRQSSTVAEVETTFAGIAADSGACAFIICDIPPGCAPGAREIHSSGWHPDWERKYLERRYAEVDPVPNSVNSHNEPYFWRDLIVPTTRNAPAANVMQEARAEFRMHDGFCIPVHGLEGVAGLVSLATEDAAWSLSEQEQAAMHLVGLYAYEAVRRIKRPQSPAAIVRLSPREADCIRWLAEGKTAWEIGAILGVSEATVRTYLKAAARKLDTRSQAHLVARAHRLGLIH
ncbi:LuxR family transcriptional regulator [Lichenihabitans sp. Uapishka_5]|uniref:helix-turn-helix transcriptional regulator n=1 Tax=Lichenihabitans sp. Uapishka_5 TaxID=3037302 RepID=UPI0029E809A3|nr:LuxR family transcriptional regulator [Lichenihabitans sp. Uapishka_5]MDX7950845.1 LuxR family transcriptional regulator [Lichenihabitans sp. Uapishka_5]